MQHSHKITPSQNISLTNERSDHYAHIICRLGPRWRLIICSDFHQWIAQFDKCPGIQPNWTSEKFFRTRAGLESFLKSTCKKCKFYRGTLKEVSNLPEHFNELKKIEKAAAKDKSLTTASLDNRKYTGIVSNAQHFADEVKYERS